MFFTEGNEGNEEKETNFWLLFKLLIGTGKDHTNNSVGEFYFVEIDDKSYGNIEQFHVAE